MNNKEFKQLVEAVKKDPALLHALAFEPERAAQKATFISETERTMLTGLQAENLLANALGLLSPERVAQCTTTCERTSDCGLTRNGNLGGHRQMQPEMQGYVDNCTFTSCGNTNECGSTSVHPQEVLNSPTQQTGRFTSRFYHHLSFGNFAGCGADATCSCSSGTCGGDTCGGSTCGVTCSGDSCGNTCGNSCDSTSNYSFDPWEKERLLARQLNQALVWR